MPYRTFIRQFTDNNKYGEFEKVPHLDALAHVVEEFVYSDKLDGDLLHFRMKEEIPMFDFMTLAAYFISESQQDFGKSTIVGFVEDLKAQYRGGITTTHVEYPDNYLFVTCASYELIMGLLWTTYIYHSACYMFSKNEKFAEISSMVYGVMVEESGLKKEAFLKGSLSENASSARKTMLSYMVRNEVRNGLKKEEAPKESSAENDSKKDARIAELEAELKKTKEENVQLKKESKEIVPANAYEKIIFFATVLSAAYDAGFTNQLELSEFICTICGGSPTTFQPRISKLSSMSATGKYEQEVIHAAQRIVERLKKVPKGGDKGNPRILDIINSIEGEFELRKYK